MTTERCQFDEKKVFDTKADALREIGGNNHAMSAYMGPCGRWHVGHRRGYRGPKGRLVGGR
jgi:leucyl-tRNA synthetase